jgi:hypothetical protein
MKLTEGMVHLNTRRVAMSCVPRVEKKALIFDYTENQQTQSLGRSRIWWALDC